MGQKLLWRNYKEDIDFNVENQYPKTISILYRRSVQSRLSDITHINGSALTRRRIFLLYSSLTLYHSFFRAMEKENPGII